QAGDGRGEGGAAGVAGVERDLHRRAEPDAREIRFPDVRADVDAAQVRNRVERLPALHDLAFLGVGDEHGPLDRIPNLTLAHALADDRGLRVGRRDLADAGLALRARRFDLLRLRRDLMILRGDLIGLGGDLLREHADVALRLIELLRGRRLLAEQPFGPLVGALRDLVL